MNMEAIITTLWPKFLAAGMSVVWALVFLFIGIKAIKYLRKFLQGVLERSNVDTGVIQFLDGFVKIAAYVILALVLLAHFGVQTTSFITILGTAGVAVGLSLQGSLSNFAGGILILVLKPFKVGDFVSASSCEGTVMEISLFATTLHTVDNRNVILPNGTLANGTIINYSANESRRVDMSVSVAYGSDLKKAQRVIHEILDNDERILKEPACVVAVDELADSGITILIRPWVLSGDYWDVKWSVLETVHNRFEEEQIEIPFPQMTVHLENADS
ncbi:MAG: mechanosensitive ion channel [Lachnospiraceae bacterium]|nr:mechanosensitive ion channel [Lachnospiraceae bacterium]